VQREMVEIREQLALEDRTRKASSWQELFTRRYARRLLLACFILNMTKLSEGNWFRPHPDLSLHTNSCAGVVVQNYQSLFYAGLGYKGRNVLLLSGCYGFMGVIGQVMNMIWVSDKWPRKRTMCESPLPLP
jgi:hypothetical protein